MSVIEVWWVTKFHFLIWDQYYEAGINWPEKFPAKNICWYWFYVCFCFVGNYSANWYRLRSIAQQLTGKWPRRTDSMKLPRGQHGSNPIWQEVKSASGSLSDYTAYQDRNKPEPAKSAESQLISSLLMLSCVGTRSSPLYLDYWSA